MDKGHINELHSHLCCLKCDAHKRTISLEGQLSITKIKFCCKSVAKCIQCSVFTNNYCLLHVPSTVDINNYRNHCLIDDC